MMAQTQGQPDPTLRLPPVIQGGMGAGVSDWRLARSVSIAGQLGVVAGTALDVILSRRLQLGDPGGHMRRALACFPFPALAQRILARHFISGGKPLGRPFRGLPLLAGQPDRERSELLVAANFVELHLAGEGHAGLLGINYLEKIQLPTLPSLFGAMLAGVHCVLMGAGLPRAIPGILDDLARWRPVQLGVDVRGAAPEAPCLLRFDPRSLLTEGETPAPLRRPQFLAIVSNAAVAKVMLRKSSGLVDGLVLEGPSAGGHNAPARGGAPSHPAGTPRAQDADRVAIAGLGVPFWLAGSQGAAGALEAAQRQGARGIQVGSAFAFCRESGLEQRLKQRALRQIQAGAAQVITDPLASPTGFPFKVFPLEGTLSEAAIFKQRTKRCDLGYLRHAYRRPDGRVGWRCPGEPERAFLHKGGPAEEIEGRKCVCNGLMANIGLGQVSAQGYAEPPILTSGSDLGVVRELLASCGFEYGASDVLDLLQANSLARA